MINRGILQQRLLRKFQTLGLHCIVNECFIHGLPLDQNEITSDDKKMLTRYSFAVLEQLGGFSILEKAMESKTLTDNQKLYLADIYNICTEAANETKDRICKETDCKNPSTTLSEVVDTASMSDKEYQSFVTKADSMDIGQVSEIIKQKTINVLKDEKEQMEKDAELDDALKEALDGSDMSEEITKESYLDMFIDKTAPKHPVTLFSRLNDSAMESIAITQTKNAEYIAPVLYRATFEGFLPELEKRVDMNQIATESFDTATEDCCRMTDEVKPKVALLVSTIVYTIMETLKTLNLYCPSKASLTKFVMTPISSNEIKKKSRDHIVNDASDMIRSLVSMDISKISSELLSQKALEIRKITDDLQILLQDDPSDGIVSQFICELDSKLLKINEIINQKTVTLKSVDSATESYQEKRNRSETIAGFNHVNAVMGNHPLISEIILKVDPNVPSCIAVEGLDSQHSVCKQSQIVVNAALESDRYLQYLSDAYKQSSLVDKKKKVFVLETDGRGRKVPL